jgi:hypothetical protein
VSGLSAGRRGDCSPAGGEGDDRTVSAARDGGGVRSGPGAARAWYEEKLGVTPKIEAGEGLWYEFAPGTWLLVYQTDSAGTAKNTVAG